MDSEIYSERIRSYIDRYSLKELIAGHDIEICVPAGEVSKVTGHQKLNKRRLQDEYYVKNIKVVEKKDILRYNINISVVD